MIASRNSVSRKIGDKVRLRTNCGYGSLSALTLGEHGANNDTLVEIVALNEHNYDYTVCLPDGYRLKIDECDVSTGGAK